MNPKNDCIFKNWYEKIVYQSEKMSINILRGTLFFFFLKEWRDTYWYRTKGTLDNIWMDLNMYYEKCFFFFFGEKN